MDFLLLTSAKNPKIKHACSLRERRERDREGVTLLEGYRELSRAHLLGIPIRECFFAPELFLGENEYPLLEELKKSGAEVWQTTPEILTKLAYRDRPEGLIAIAAMQKKGLESIPVKPNGLYLVAETIEKPGNLGSILRSADAVNATGVIVCNRQTDIFNPNVIRASTGAIFSVPLAETSSEEAVAWLRANGIKSLAATPHTDKIYTETDMTGPIAIVVGAEQYGLSDYWMNEADLQVVIPMLGKMDSLNVATAATLLLYEAARQRNWKS
ncbi:MAG: RNA methyltransferase [Lentisphaeria bacterium]|nr:RNA methyltransferase [Lentisphaerota bacterium]MBQ6597547.1 RNA methyltransferase [Lentisphaeria bacterium]MBR4666632.1 RNA methyltransferase [Lentisphaeria bacterium]